MTPGVYLSPEALETGNAWKCGESMESHSFFIADVLSKRQEIVEELEKMRIDGYIWYKREKAGWRVTVSTQGLENFRDAMYRLGAIYKEG